MIDIHDLVDRFAAAVERAEHQQSRDARRLGRVFQAAAKELESSSLILHSVTIDELVTVLSKASQDLLEEGSGHSDAQALRYLLQVARPPAATKSKVGKLLHRWEQAQKAKQEVEIELGEYDLPYPVEVSKAGSDRSVVSGVRGKTRWHNLRAQAVKVFGKMTVKDNDIWLRAKHQLADGVEEVREGVWTFKRSDADPR